MRGLLGRLLLVVVIAIVPAAAFHAYSVEQAVQARRELARNESLRLLGLVNTEQLRIIEGAEQTLDGIDAALKVLGYRPDLCHQLLVNIQQQAPRYVNAGIIGLDGRLTCSAMPDAVGLDVSDRAFVQDALRTGHLVVGEYMVGRAAPQPIFVIAKPFRDALGHLAGLLEVSMSLEWLGQQLAQLPLPDYAFARIADRDGIVLARRSPGSGDIGKRILAANNFSLDGDQPGVQPGGSRFGHPTSLAYSPPGRDRNRFAIAVSIDPEIAFADVLQADRIGLALLIAGGALALALTALFGNQLIGRPVAALIDAADRWRAGALESRTTLRHGRDEFGRLASAFDDMAETLERRERALRDSQAMLTAALAGMTDAVFISDAAGNLIHVNNAFATFHRIPNQADDVRSLAEYPAFLEVFLETNEPVQQDQWAVPRALRGETAVGAVYRLRRKDTGESWIASYNLAPIRDAQGTIVGSVVTARDITEQLRVAEALRDSEERLRLALECAMIGAWTVTQDGNFEATPQAKILHGMAADAPLDHQIALQAVHPDDRDMIAARLHDTWTAGAVFEVEMRAVLPDGTIRWLASRGRRVEPAGGPARLFGIVQDVTARKQAESELRRLTETLEQRVQQESAAREAAQARAAQAERMQALGQLAGGIAHDFNNVLQGLQGVMQLIERRPADEKGVLRLVKLSSGALDRGASVTRRLLALARTGELKAEPVDPAVLLAGLHEVLSHTLGAGIVVRLDLEPALPRIMADRAQLETVMINLATNGRDAMPVGGELTIAARQLLVTQGDPLFPATLSSGAYVLLQVSDEGTGMDAATLARAREPFFTTKKAGAGTGLGLAMAHSFAEQTAGALTIDSQPGDGTAVTLWLPVTQADTAIVAAPPAPMLNGSPHILVVDDEPLICEVLAQHLRDAGFSVRTAATGTEALQVGRSGRLDAVVCDLSMPGMDGLSVIRALQSMHPNLPAVLLTGYAGDEAAIAAIGPMGGAFALLRKPVSDVELLDQIGVLLAARQHGSSRQENG